MKECQFYEQLPNNQVKCTCCNHYCKINPGKTGICGVRVNQNGKLYLIVNEKPSAVHVDPIEKKPMYHFYPGSRIFSLGTVGCNFKCEFCQNHSLSMERIPDIEDFQQSTQTVTADQIIRQCVQQKINAVAFTYNEPTIWTEYALDICKAAKEKGIKCVYVSNGFMSKEVREVLINNIQGINIDLKAFSDETYMKILGGHLEPVKDNIKFFFDHGVITEVTTLLVPQMNDSDEEIRQCAEFLHSISSEIPWHISAFHPDYKMMDRKRTSDQLLLKAFRIGREIGLQNIYLGNTTLNYEDTSCSCGQLLIKRESWVVKQVHQVCPKCGKKPYGMYE